MTLQQELDELYDLKAKIESHSFQKHIMKPLYEEIDSLKASYQCESLRELATLKGKNQGLRFLINRLKEIDVELKNKRYELESQG
jgi:hypothetical protein